MNEHQSFHPVLIRCNWLIILLAALLTVGCSAQHQLDDEMATQLGSPKEREISEWIKKNILRPATPKELRLAKSFTRSFENATAVSPDGHFEVRFAMGYSQPLGNGTFSPGSHYSVLEKASGKELARLTSTLSHNLNAPNTNPFEHQIWFLPDGRILIQEIWADGCGPHGMLALVEPSSSPNLNVHYLALPEFDGFPNPSQQPEAFGIIGDWIVFDPCLSEGPFKKKLSEIRKVQPPALIIIGERSTPLPWCWRRQIAAQPADSASNQDC